MPQKNFWERGQKTQLAQVAGIQTSHLSEILHRKRRVSFDRAFFLESCSIKVLGKQKRIPWDAWLLNESTNHPAFSGTPKPLTTKGE